MGLYSWAAAAAVVAHLHDSVEHMQPRFGCCLSQYMMVLFHLLFLLPSPSPPTFQLGPSVALLLVGWLAGLNFSTTIIINITLIVLVFNMSILYIGRYIYGSFIWTNCFMAVLPSTTFSLSLLASSLRKLWRLTRSHPCQRDPLKGVFMHPQDIW